MTITAEKQLDLLKETNRTRARAKSRTDARSETTWAIIPPRKNAEADPGNRSWERDASIRGIQRNDRQAWNKAVSYHRRSLAETAVNRLKRIVGERLKNRERPNQENRSRHPSKTTQLVRHTRHAAVTLDLGSKAG